MAPVPKKDLAALADEDLRDYISDTTENLSRAKDLRKARIRKLKAKLSQSQRARLFGISIDQIRRLERD